MANSILPVPQRTRPAVTPPKGITAKTPTVVINTSTQPRSPRRWAFRHPDRIEIGGGALFPKIKCSRKDIGAAVLAIGAAAALVYGAKSVHEYFKNLWTRKAEESQVPIPDPPKVEAVINCVNSVGKPKDPLVPDMVYERSISVIAGRPNGGKTLLAQQLAIELARGDGELVGEDIPPQNVIIVDSVINTGKTIEDILDPDMYVACCVINENAVAKFEDRLYTVRVSKNSFVGAGVKKQAAGRGPDTTMRLFNQI